MRVLRRLMKRLRRVWLLARYEIAFYTVWF